MLFENERNMIIDKYWKWVYDMKLLDQVHDVMRRKHYSIRTEHAY